MIRTFVLTSQAFEGEVLFEFMDDILLKFDASGAKLNEQQHLYIAKYLPRELAEIKEFLAQSKSLKFEEITNQEVSFNMFWNKYDDKATSSKVKTERQWNKMPKSQQIRAFKFIGTYFASIPNGTRKKYATTYLSDALWNN